MIRVVRARILTFYPSRIPDPGVKRHRIPYRIRNTDRYRTLGRYHRCVIANSDNCNKVSKQEPVNNKTFRTTFINSAADLERSDLHQFFLPDTNRQTGPTLRTQPNKMYFLHRIAPNQIF